MMMELTYVPAPATMLIADQDLLCADLAWLVPPARVSISKRLRAGRKAAQDAGSPILPVVNTSLLSSTRVQCT